MAPITTSCAPSWQSETQVNRDGGSANTEQVDAGHLPSLVPQGAGLRDGSAVDSPRGPAFVEPSSSAPQVSTDTDGGDPSADAAVIAVCAPGTKTCADDGNVKTCDSQGHGSSTTACPSEKPICTGKGSCAQCAQATDCPAGSECAIASCKSGTCVTSSKAANTPCSEGICDAKGTCGPAPTCGDGVVNQPSEQCDDGNGSNIDDCTSACKLAVCGDGVINSVGPNRTIENCEPGVGGETAWTCDPIRCQRQTMYKACTSKSECSPDEGCSFGMCTRSCSPSDGLGSETDCPTPPPPLSAWCQSGAVLCRLVNCSVNPDCPRGQQCKILSADDRAGFSQKVFKSLCAPP